MVWFRFLVVVLVLVLFCCLVEVFFGRVSGDILVPSFALVFLVWVGFFPPLDGLSGLVCFSMCRTEHLLSPTALARCQILRAV